MSGLTISDQLHAVRALIEDEARWCQYWFAVDEEGDHVVEDDASAVAWCVVGACRKLHVSSSARDDLRRISLEMFGLYADEVNDRLGHAAVVQLLDAAIAEAERENV